jgi:hypothetical protein
VVHLQEDMEETEVVVKALAQLLLGDQAQRISSLVPQIVQVGQEFTHKSSRPQCVHCSMQHTISRIRSHTGVETMKHCIMP